MTGYAGLGNIIDFTNSYTNNYNSLQMQLNRRVGQTSSGTSTTRSPGPSFTTTAQRQHRKRLLQFVNAELTKNVTNRRHAINFNFGYDFPT